MIDLVGEEDNSRRLRGNLLLSGQSVQPFGPNIQVNKDPTHSPQKLTEAPSFASDTQP